MIIRSSRYRPMGNKNVGPNTTEYCIQCQAIKPNGYEIRDPVELSQRLIFVCDDCLAAAKRYGKVGSS